MACFLTITSLLFILSSFGSLSGGTRSKSFLMLPGWGLSMGLAILSRPSEMVLYPDPPALGYLWQEIPGCENADWFSGIGNIFWSLREYVPCWVAAARYWKTVTGQWLYYSYNNPGEGLDFWSPIFHEFPFSFRKGWLIYTPVMTFALAGIYLLHKQQKTGFSCIYYLFYYLIYGFCASWTAWWYGGGSYSQRAMLPSYVILAIPLGYVVDQIRQSGKNIRIPLFSILLILAMLNIFPDLAMGAWNHW